MIGFWLPAGLAALAGAGLAGSAPFAARRAFGVLVAAGVVAVAAALFWAAGGAPLPGAPAAARVAALRAIARADADSLTPAERLAVLKAIAAERPDDAEAWRFLGYELLNADRVFEAVDAYERALDLAPTPDAMVRLGAGLVRLNDGRVTPEARALFEAARARAPDQPDARWHLALAELQAGREAEALAGWGALAVDLADDDPRKPLLMAEAVDALARPQAGPVAPGDVPATEAPVQAMVERLAARLAANPGDFAGWLRLARARTVLGEADGARAAAAGAKAAAGDDAGLNRLADIARVMYAPDVEEARP